ncbi:integral membrane protein [Legionella israelensis]|nr:integral membrane protein [Legionella israelensis]SCY23649.1 hypothetical protein SAMN02746069_01739 [Legionella israelensis DSM 19235]STX60507.1 integral membrane protein [Legionella israelensis]
MFYKWSRRPAERLSFYQYMTLCLSGIIAFIADTVGVGSFAVNVALAKLFGTFQDDELPAVCNGAQVIPGIIESFFFMHLVNVDVKTLVTLVSGACVGGLIGGWVVSFLSKQAIRLAMIACFALLIILVIVHQLHVFSIGGDLIALHSWRLFIGFWGMIICGALTSVGIGLFVMVQAVLFLLNVSPLIAFPIMTTAGAMQQPLTTLVFLQQNKIPLKKTLILSLSGCLGVVLILPWFTQLAVKWLHSLLLFILIYNFIIIGRAYLHSRLRQKYKQPHALAVE